MKRVAILAGIGAFAVAAGSAEAQWRRDPVVPLDVAQVIAIQHGIVVIADTEITWRGNYEVEGVDASGHEIEVEIDGQTGAVLEINS